jgi:TRAP-type C4-dicarboxylate transport system permease large subunit
MAQQAASHKRQDFAPRRGALMLWTSVIALCAVVLLIIALSGSTSRAYSRGAIAAAVLLLILRLISRVLKVRTSRAAKPDPQSTLKLD